MTNTLKNCWDIKGCGRSTGGHKVKELGECIASKEKLGHSCWIVAGTLCGGEVQGEIGQKRKNCMECKVFKLYHRDLGPHGKEVIEKHPEEHAKYRDILVDVMKKS